MILFFSYCLPSRKYSIYYTTCWIHICCHRCEMCMILSLHDSISLPRELNREFPRSYGSHCFFLAKLGVFPSANRTVPPGAKHTPWAAWQYKPVFLFRNHFDDYSPHQRSVGNWIAFRHAIFSAWRASNEATMMSQASALNWTITATYAKAPATWLIFRK